MRKVIISLVAFSGFVWDWGCCARSWRLGENHRFIATGWDNALPDVGQVEPTYPLDFDAVYMTDPSRIEEDFQGSFGGVLWMRFWAGGQCITGWRSAGNYFRSPVTASDADTFINMDGGRYWLQGTHLTTEHLKPSEDLLCKLQYFREKGEVNTDGSITLKIHNDTGDYFLTFSPKHVGKLTRQPDWPAR